MLTSPLPIERRRRIIVCRSDAEADAFRSAGFKSVRVVEHTEQVMTIKNREPVADPNFDFFDEIVLAFGPGDEELRDGIAARLDDTKCRWVDWGGGTAERLLAECGTVSLIEAVTSARPMWVDEVCLLSDIPDSGPPKPYACGLGGLDAHGFRIIRPVFWPVIGPYGSGKSVLIRQIACNLLRLHGWRTLITSFEEKVKPRYLRDLRRHLIGEEIVNDRDGVGSWRPKFETAWTAADVAAADAEIEHGFRFLRRKRGAILDMDRLLDRIHYAVRVYGVEVVIIDPVNEIDHQVPRGESKTDYMGRFMIQLKQLADDYNLVMIVLAHPPKDGVEKRSSKGRLLTLNDAADTAHYGNKADIGWTVWRPTVESATYLNIDKLKDHDVMGKPTLAKLVLNQLTGGFTVQKIGYDAVLEELMGE